MKKAICVMVCCALTLCCACAGAKTFEFSIFEVLRRQIDTNSSYRVQLTGAVEGTAPSFVSNEMWEMLKELLPEYAVEGTYVLSKASKTLHDEQTRVMVKRSGETLGTLVLSGRDDRYVLSGDLLGDQSMAFARDMNALTQMLTPVEEGQWPTPMRIALVMLTAGEEWWAQLDAALTPCYAAMTEWVMDYTAVSVTRDENGALCTRSVVTLDADAVREQAGNMLRMMLTNPEIMALLEEIMTQEEARVYLQDGMIPLYDELLSGAQLGDMVLERSYDADGNLLEQMLTLPFAGAVEKVQATQSGGQWGLNVRFGSGAQLHFTLQGGGTYSRAYTGTFAWEAADQQVSGSFMLTAELGMEQYDETNTGRERSQTHTLQLLLIPDEGQSFPAQTLDVTCRLIGGASNQNASRLNIAFEWRPQGADTCITFNYKSYTAQTIAQLEVDPDMAVQLDAGEPSEVWSYLISAGQTIWANLLDAVTAVAQ